MQNFLEIAKTDFSDTFSGAFLFPVLMIGILWILWKEKDWLRKILLGVLPLVFLFFYWCPVTGIVLYENIGRECVLENSVAFLTGGDHSLCGMSVC